MLKSIVRTARPSDAEAISAIYTESIAARDSTMDLETFSVEAARRLIENLRKRESICVYVHSGEVRGWGIVKLYSDRPGYRSACETSVYVFRDSTGKGIGSQLQRELMNRAIANDFHHIVTKIWAANTSSIAFHEKFGFTLVGIQREIGYVDGQRKDIAVMQCILEADN